MEKDELKKYIQQRLQELEKQKDMQEMIYKGKLSFGISSQDYSHLPAWKALLRQKKIMVRLYWLEVIFLSLMVVGITTDVWDKFSLNWWKPILEMLLLSAVIALFFVGLTFFNLFVQFRNTEREVRKLIYQDILHRIEIEEKAAEKSTLIT